MIDIKVPKNFDITEVDAFRKEVNSYLESGEKDFSVNFGECEFIDSTGLGVLISIYKKCKELDEDLVIHSVNKPQVVKIFKLTRLDRAFNINI